METYISKIIQHTIVTFEGTKYTNIVGDAGGPTKFGVTQRALAGYLNRPVSVDEVKNMTIETATDVYKKDYWDYYDVGSYPKEVQHLIFDLYVQHRPEAVGKIIQRGLNMLGQKLLVDGDIGKKTMTAIACVTPEELITTITRARVAYYNSIVASKPTQAKFLKGWLNRANWFLNNKL